jgi:hypothetical protein
MQIVVFQHLNDQKKGAKPFFLFQILGSLIIKRFRKLFHVDFSCFGKEHIFQVHQAAIDYILGIVHHVKVVSIPITG